MLEKRPGVYLHQAMCVRRVIGMRYGCLEAQRLRFGRVAKGYSVEKEIAVANLEIS